MCEKGCGPMYLEPICYESRFGGTLFLANDQRRFNLASPEPATVHCTNLPIYHQTINHLPAYFRI
jgi:hypothetical protein